MVRNENKYYRWFAIGRHFRWHFKTRAQHYLDTDTFWNLNVLEVASFELYQEMVSEIVEFNKLHSVNQNGFQWQIMIYEVICMQAKNCKDCHDCQTRETLVYNKELYVIVIDLVFSKRYINIRQ
jgi:hypothetical protein